MPNDNISHIIKTARVGKGLSIRSLSDKLGVRPQDLLEIEAGRGKITLSLAAELGLSLPKLTLIPAKKKKSRAPVMPKKISVGFVLKQYEVGVAGFPANAYLLFKAGQKKGRSALLVDSLGVSKSATQVMAKDHLKPVALLITHGHFDHIAGCDLIRQSYPKIKVFRAAQDIGNEGLLPVSDFLVEVFKTPGHTEDSVSYLVEGKILFTGDTLFAGSVGRPNFDYQLLLKNIREKILTLPEDTIICPGHGSLTTVGREKKSNPFFLS
ncbi:MAG: hypothetical protein A2445_04685 [Candidatus Jacksonbacteria bacterium RIFOXYC2_FULL_44_29]|nr:MAG: Hydroxyacylglutathione hydrolase [Parcubacteria group bacterium GW2011_GWC2_44_22]OGY76709.1 MAG: hypothetical protein A2295_06070 [Candidatus Jacksonbacteria bacterium RIFOXYB2_FULL_44_15]OGY78037.1 MAG: hypothetical protein A2445_04685 [Candidatus Jacksonbacteria bacterium RIFOXYC2_FULL_44_29]OGY81871.1 MAG: hypothetical protein A2550_03105 [Candidatus Jacksonbacteria bacterium RIFOXYD2_FULL_43_21]